MATNHEMTIKLPRVVHRSLKLLSASRSIPIYALIAQMLLKEMETIGPEERFSKEK